MELFNFLANGLMILLLGVGIYFAIRLERQLINLRETRGEMGRYIAAFGSNIARAEAGVQGLKQTARVAGDDLEKLLDRASAMRDELQTVTAHADQLAGRITELGTQLGQQARTSENTPRVAVVESATAAPQPKTRAEQELLRAIETLR